MCRILFIIIMSVASVFLFKDAHAQRPNHLALARNYVAQGQTDSALMMYKIAYEAAPFEVKLYNEYLTLLLDNKYYEQADALTNRMAQLRPEDANMMLDKAKILELQGKNKEKEKLIQTLIQQQYTKNTYHIHQLANAFVSRQMIDEAVELYEKATKHHNNTQIFSKELMNLYLEQGHVDRVIPYFAEFIPYYPNLNEDIKSKILKLIDKDAKNKSLIEKALNKEIKKNNAYINEYISLLNWLKQLDGDRSAALEELIKINKNNSSIGIQDIIKLGQEAMVNNEFTVAHQAFSYLEKSTDRHVKEIALTYLIRNNYRQLYQQKPVSPSLVAETLNRFAEYFELFPQKAVGIEYLWYADVVSKFDKRPEVGIEMMNNLLSKPQLPQQIIGIGKLLLGDFYLFSGKIWDANLSYAQVDKLFKQDKLGEEARYKQAKLAFYRGDFKWAQNQLDVLKASTTELISNDAMQLSIMITENTVNDTLTEPLKRFAKADLMMYQQQYAEAVEILKSIIETYPENDIIDDVYLLLGQVAVESGQYAEAVGYFNKIITDFYDDVLADDALKRLAQLYHKHLNDKANAIKYYEKLITDFPNSSLVPESRSDYNALIQSNKL